VGYCYPSGLEKTHCKWDIYVLLVKKRLSREFSSYTAEYWRVAAIICHYAAAGFISSIVHSPKLTQDSRHWVLQSGLCGQSPCNSAALSTFVDTIHKFCFEIYTLYKYYMSYIVLYRVSQEKETKLWESVPYVKIYRYNLKHLYTKLNGYGDNGPRKVRSSGGSTHCTCQLIAFRGSVLHCRVRLQKYCWCCSSKLQ
jgi:hypothetical protein